MTYKMGTATIALSFLVVFLVTFANTATASSKCPPPSQIYQYSKKEECHSDSQCSGSKICCVTPARNRACVEPAFGGSSAGYKDKYQTGGTGMYCGNVKCMPYEKCITDPKTKRQRCGRY